jgi:hypothetical protein
MLDNAACLGSDTWSAKQGTRVVVSSHPQVTDVPVPPRDRTSTTVFPQRTGQARLRYTALGPVRSGYWQSSHLADSSGC